MTASDLHHLFASTASEQESYQGGRDGWQVDSKYGDIHLSFTETTGRTAATWVRRLDDEDLDDLELALKRARAARDNYRANELRRTG